MEGWSVVVIVDKKRRGLVEALRRTKIGWLKQE